MELLVLGVVIVTISTVISASSTDLRSPTILVVLLSNTRDGSDTNVLVDEGFGGKLDELVISMLVWLAAVLSFLSQVLQLAHSDLLHGLKDSGQLLILSVSWESIADIS